MEPGVIPDLSRDAAYLIICSVILQWYVTWNFHEPKPGVYRWDNFADVERFLEIANELDLMVLFRPGPYACAEWEFGGLPWWLASERVLFLLLTAAWRSGNCTYHQPLDLLEVANAVSKS